MNGIEDTVSIDRLKPAFFDAEEPSVPSHPPDRKEISPAAVPNAALECPPFLPASRVHSPPSRKSHASRPAPWLFMHDFEERCDVRASNIEFARAAGAHA